MKVLVIGGNSLFGFELVNQLLGRRFDVHVMNRGNHKPKYNGSVHHHKCDKENLKDFTQVAHMTWDIVFDQYCMNEEHALAIKKIFGGYCKRYVMTSSQSVYHAGADLDEEDFRGEEYKFSAKELEKNSYAENKRRADSIILACANLNPLVVRPPVVMGERDHTLRLKWHMDKIMNSEEIYFPNIDASISFVHAIDLARNMVLLAKSGAVGAVNICSGKPIVLKNFIAMIEAKVDKKTIIAKTPTDKNHSPYGIEEDWWMNTTRLKSLGGQTREILDWLPELIEFNLRN